MPPLILPIITGIAALGSFGFHNLAADAGNGGAAWLHVLAACTWLFVTVTGQRRLGRVSRTLSARHLKVHAEKAGRLPVLRGVAIVVMIVFTLVASAAAVDSGSSTRVTVTGIAAFLVAVGIHSAYAGHHETMAAEARAQVGHGVSAADRMMPGKHYRAEWSAILHRMGIADSVRASRFTRHPNGDVTIKFWVAVGLSPETIQKRMEAICQAWNVHRADPAVRDASTGLIAVRFSNLPAPEKPVYAKAEEQIATTAVNPAAVFDLTTKEEK